MRKSYKVFFLLLAGLTGCVPVDSINPLYTDRNVIFEPTLLGKWTGSNPDDGFLRFERGDNDAYQLIVTQKNKTTIFDAHLVSLGGEKYLDVSPRQFEDAA